MNRFWVSWWSGYYADEGCTQPPFQIWESGVRDRDEKRDEVSLCACIDAETEIDIWEAVEKYFPDYEQRFCEPRDFDWRPGARFPDFKNRTSLKG